MKKNYLSIALLFETIACIGAYFMQHFTAKKMGMLRWVNHLCNKWSKSIDLDRLNLIFMLFVSVFSLILLSWTIKNAKEKIWNFAPMIATALVSVSIYLVLTIRYTRKMMAAYYFVSPILLLGAMIALCCWALTVQKSD